jgi:hypothetical protein
MIRVNEQAISITLDNDAEYYVGDYEMIIQVTTDKASIFDTERLSLSLSSATSIKNFIIDVLRVPYPKDRVVIKTFGWVVIIKESSISLMINQENVNLAGER